MMRQATRSHGAYAQPLPTTTQPFDGTRRACVGRTRWPRVRPRGSAVDVAGSRVIALPPGTLELHGPRLLMLRPAVRERWT